MQETQGLGTRRSSQCWIDDFAKYAHHKSKRYILAMIQAYLDESGIHDGAAICVIAGYFGGHGQMKKLGAAWGAVLKRYDVVEFHAKEFWGFNSAGERIGQYLGWTRIKADRFLDELLSVIESHKKIHPVASGVVVESFNRLTYNQRRFVTGGHLVNGRFKSSGCPSKPYFLPFQSVVVDAAEYAPVGGKAHFFFDLNKQFKGYALDLFALLKSQGLKATDRLGDIDFPTGVEAVQLQAADLLCYQSYQLGLQKMSDPSAKHNPILDRLLVNRVTQTDSLFNDQTFPLVLDGIQLPPEENTI